MSRIHDLADEAEELGIADALADVMASYLEAAQTAAEEYEDFHWGDESEGGTLVEVSPMPPVLTSIGPLVAITYEASKRGQLAHWEHLFEDERPVLAYDPVTERLYIVGGDYRVTTRGIVG